MKADLHRALASVVALVVALAVCAPAAAQPEPPALDPQIFPVPTVLAPNVAFWRDVFSKYDSTETVIHDNLNLDVVYTVVDVGDLKRAGASDFTIERESRRRVRAAIDHYEEVLRALAGGREASADPADMARVRGLFANSARGESDFRAAIDRVRGQGGLRDTFREALATSGMFMPGIEQIFASHGVPVEIARLPFVESMFNYEARSSAGASGVWQFTRSTGRLYLQINSAVDARSDVWLAADAAARMLAEHYAKVQSWPIAITAYNHGIAGMARAVSRFGRDIGAITDQYDSPSFGFASRNFYAEFVAAATVYADRAAIFPEVEPLAPVTFDEFTPGKYVSLLDLAHLTRTPAEAIAKLNPALETDVVSGHLLIPADYPLRVPPGTAAAFEQALDRLPDERKLDRQLALRYRVERGDTLGVLARRFGTSIAALERANGLQSSRLRVGQVLEMPNGGGTWTPLVWTGADERAPAAIEAAAVHIVRAGETLTRIARQYGTSVQTLIRTNNLISTVIHVGQELHVPAN